MIVSTNNESITNERMKTLQRNDLVLPELSYTIIGCAFDVYNELGHGHHEKYYQRALAEAFMSAKLNIKQQAYYPLQYHNKTIGKQFLDFLVEEKVIVEIKKDGKYSKQHIDQVLQYLANTNLQLAILINFSSQGISFKRIINFPKKYS